MTVLAHHNEIDTAIELPHRSTLPVEQTWDVEAIYASSADFDEAVAITDSRIPTLAGFADQLGNDAATLLATLTLRDEIAQVVSRVSIYAELRFSEDAGNSAYASLLSRTEGLSARFGSATAFIDAEMLSIAPTTLDGFLAHEPGLAPYRFVLDHLRRTGSLRR